MVPFGGYSMPLSYRSQGPLHLDSVKPVLLITAPSRGAQAYSKIRFLVRRVAHGSEQVG